MLAKKDRLKKQADFNKLYKTGNRVGNNNFLVFYLPSKYQKSAMAVVISKKVEKKAIKRNKLKRQITEYLRKNWQKIQSPIYFIISTKKNLVKLSKEELYNELENILKKARIFT